MFDQFRLLILLFLIFWLGVTLVFSGFRWFRRPTLTERLISFAGNSLAARKSNASATFQDALRPLAFSFGERIAKVFGLNEDLQTRMLRANIVGDSSAFRMKQVGWAAGLFAAILLVCLSIQPPPLVGLLFLIGAPLLGFLIPEQQIVNAAQIRQRRIFAELPVMSEQLAILLGAGYSLGAALNRVALRSSGVSGEDLLRVCDRIRHGLSVTEALNEWAERVSVPELNRLVSVLSLNSETSDLGSLVSEEARTIRKEAARRLMETIEKRAQQVWVPVTVATLVPGIIFLMIPFMHALTLLSGS